MEDNKKEESVVGGLKKYFKWRLKIAVVAIVVIAIYVIISYFI